MQGQIRIDPRKRVCNPLRVFPDCRHWPPPELNEASAHSSRGLSDMKRVTVLRAPTVENGSRRSYGKGKVVVGAY